MSAQETIEAPATDGPQMPVPTAGHDWLRQIAGEWESDVELHCSPDGSPTRTTGRETARMLGGFWLLSEASSDSPEFPYTNLISIGYDPEKGKYIATCVDTMTSRLWLYEGTVNEAGTKLTLDTEGGCPMEPGKTRQFRESIEMFGADRKTFTSEMRLDDGSWAPCVKVSARRVK